MNGLAFSSPSRLLLLLVVAALAVAYVVRQRRASRYALRLPGLDLLASVAPSLGWRRHAAAVGMLLAMTGATAAFAEPTAQVQVPRERATIVVALDVSLSMQATDVDPDRITAAKAAATSFVEGLPDRFNVELVAFSGSATAVVPATQEHDEVVQAIAGLTLGEGTAIGEAVLTSVGAVAAVPTAVGQDAAPAHVVLLSDGANTQGRPVSVAVARAKAAGLPVSTIAYGTEEGTVTVQGDVVRVPVDAPALADLAEATRGQSYTAASGKELEGVYADIGSSVGTTTERREVGGGVAALALVAAVGAAGASLVWSPRSV